MDLDVFWGQCGMIWGYGFPGGKKFEDLTPAVGDRLQRGLSWPGKGEDEPCLDRVETDCGPSQLYMWSKVRW